MGGGDVAKNDPTNTHVYQLHTCTAKNLFLITCHPEFPDTARTVLRHPYTCPARDTGFKELTERDVTTAIQPTPMNLTA